MEVLYEVHGNLLIRIRTYLICVAAEVNLFWASHQTHHSSEDYTLSTALRQSATQRFSSAVCKLIVTVSSNDNLFSSCPPVIKWALSVLFLSPCHQMGTICSLLVPLSSNDNYLFSFCPLSSNGHYLFSSCPPVIKWALSVLFLSPCHQMGTICSLFVPLSSNGHYLFSSCPPVIKWALSVLFLSPCHQMGTICSLTSSFSTCPWP